MLQVKKKKYAFFDFDGTLISHDSFKKFLAKAFSRAPWRLFFVISLLPFGILPYLIRKDKTRMKSILIWSLTSFLSKRAQILLLRDLATDSSKNAWFKEAVPEIQRLKQEGFEIILVSASPEIYIRSLVREKFSSSPFQRVIGTKLGFSLFGVVVKGKNCIKGEKINRIQQLLSLGSISWEYSYSDHSDDIPLLSMAASSFVISPKLHQEKIIKKRLKKPFHILHWTSGIKGAQFRDDMPRF